jgi:trk system potassium uptake protein TrkH
MLVWLGTSLIALTAVVYAAGLYPDLPSTLRHTTFTIITLATTSGFVTEDYSLWPQFVPMWILFLSCVIPSTGSTGGGIKMFRALIMVKQAFREMFVLVHPAAVAPLKIGGQLVGNRVVYSVLAFVFVYFMTVVVLTFAQLATGMDFITAFTSTVASVNNAGPGLGQVGPATNYGALNDAQTWICSLGMFLGRVEVFTFLILFTPTFWRK